MGLSLEYLLADKSSGDGDCTCFLQKQVALCEDYCLVYNYSKSFSGEVAYGK